MRQPRPLNVNVDKRGDGHQLYNLIKRPRFLTDISSAMTSTCRSRRFELGVSTVDGELTGEISESGHGS